MAQINHPQDHAPKARFIESNLVADDAIGIKNSRRQFMQGSLLATLGTVGLAGGTLGGRLLSLLAGAAEEEHSAPQAAKKPLKVCLVSGALEYQSDESLAGFQKILETRCGIECSRAFRKADDDLPGLEHLETTDCMLLFARRLTIKGEQLERVKKYCLSGRPIVGVRTASHAFQNWLELDKLVFGGNYKNHYPDGPKTTVIITPEGKKHPILKGVEPYESISSLYKNTGVAEDVTVLLNGKTNEAEEPIAWTRLYKGARIFYTSLGHKEDFKNENFVKLLINALHWTTKRSP